MNFWTLLLLPFSYLYGWGIRLWLWAYESGRYKRVSFGLPVISVGNLSVGGTGKTPHVEWLADRLDQYVEVAVLSRGYRRNTMGFRMVEATATAEEVGDEPLQLKRKMPEVAVAVAENRLFAIPRLLMYKPATQVVLMDDAFQHLSVRPGLNLLLTEYARPYFRDRLLPAGRLREFPEGAARADALVVTKCPSELRPEQAEAFTAQLAPLPHQRVFFSTLEYGRPRRLFGPAEELALHEKLHVLFVCGIARPGPAVDYLKPRCASVHVMEYPDHYYFEKSDVSKMVRVFGQMPEEPRIVLTTEKDAVRLEAHRAYLEERGLPLYVLPVGVRFLFGGDEEFFAYLKEWLLEFKA